MKVLLTSLLTLVGCTGPDHEPYCGTSFDCGDGIVDADGDGYCSDRDCDDDDCDIFPGNTEFCDGKDNDCDTYIDGEDPWLKKPNADEGEGEIVKFYLDADGDRQCSEEFVEDCSLYADYRRYGNTTNEVEWRDETIRACVQSGYWVSDAAYESMIEACDGDTTCVAGFFDCCDDGTESTCVVETRPECWQTSVTYNSDGSYDEECVDVC